MRKLIFIFFIFFLFGKTLVAQDNAPKELCNCPGQAPLGKGTLYVGTGFNLDWYTKSDLHFKDDGEGNYDFIVHNARAEDRPGLKQLFHQNITIPQYAFRIGYYFNRKTDWGIEINYDHAKYVMIDNQVAHVTGTIHGETIDADTLVSPSWLRFEHTNGANFCLVNVLRRFSFIHSANKKHWLSAVGRYGIGFVYPRSDVTIFGINRNDKYHVAGYLTAIDIGIRYDAFHHFFIETSGKGAYVNYKNVLLPGSGRGNHHFFSFEYILNFGLQVNI